LEDLKNTRCLLPLNHSKLENHNEGTHSDHRRRPSRNDHGLRTRTIRRACIIDKAAHRTDKSKALVVWSRTLELLDRGGGSAPFVDAGFKAEAVNIIAAEKVIGRVSMESAQSPYPYGLMLPQSETERLLEERLASLGISVDRQVELISFKLHTEGVSR
jgi:2-polyprenyl-6-methoxyphenol hydroxylase-like FAD-dependent oxidoreductase